MIYPCHKCGSGDLITHNHTFKQDDNELIVLGSLICKSCHAITDLTTKYVLYETRINEAVQPYD